MSNNQVEVQFPLDSEGYLRRACPYCGREFKILPARCAKLNAEPKPPHGNLYCPYCAHFADANSWWTDAQVELISDIVHADVLHPILSRFRRSLDHFQSGFLKITMHQSQQTIPYLGVEMDDMQKTHLNCCNHFIKILDGWKSMIICPWCGIYLRLIF
jgi:uncharacterized Zn-finger protein